MLIDFHTHCFPDKIAGNAMQKLSFACGGVEPATDGTLSGLMRLMKENNVQKFAVMNIATNPKQQTNVNNFAISINSPDIIAFGSVHPDSPDALFELERIKDAGLRGVKFHPEYQGFYVDDPKMTEIYKKISDLNLITLFHAGFDPGFGPESRCLPERLIKIADKFSSPVILAHWGSLEAWTDVLNKLTDSQFYFDTSMGLGILPRPAAIKIIEKHGADKIIFGSDTPWHTPKHELTFLSTLGLSDDELSKIYFKNALKLLGTEE